MNVLFLSLGKYWSVNESELYTDLLREFIKNNHYVFIVSPIERREKKSEQIISEPYCKILKVKIGNIQKCNLIEKGLSTLAIEFKFLSAIRKSFKNIKFDLVLYPTPPITFVNVVKYIKRRDHAYSYLMLKDIFPQNALDIGLLTKHGLKGWIYKYFRMKENELYAVSDKIGCMSQANVDYIKKNNQGIHHSKITICPNAIEVFDRSVSKAKREELREKYKLPQDKLILIYGGNLGKPQGIDFLIKCIYSQYGNQDIYFLLIGDGTEFNKIEHFRDKNKPGNFRLMKRLPREDYRNLMASCDVGMLFLDHRFTIPNFPSRVLDYMAAKLPVLACTDPNTDVGKIIVENEFGWWCESNDVISFKRILEKMKTEDLLNAGQKGFEFLKENYSVDKTYNMILNGIRGLEDKS